MVEPRILDDFGPKSWVGIDYKEPQTLERIVFPAVVIEISNRNSDSRDDYIKVCMFGPEYQEKTICGRQLPEPLKLLRDYITRIWPMQEKHE